MKPSTKIILGSQSPRRKELLEKAGFELVVDSVDFEEVIPSDLPVTEVAEYLAIEKNKVFRERYTDEIIITADTVVVSNNRILGKPTDRAQAVKMLSSLSGVVHQVVTGVCISSDTMHQTTSVETEVKVKALSIKEIEYYIDIFSPFDKAGAYGIQEWFGLIAIEWIKGSYYNVMGLPIHEVYKMLLEEFDVDLKG